MKKKVFAMLMAAVVTFSMGACGSGDQKGRGKQKGRHNRGGRKTRGTQYDGLGWGNR